MRNSLLSVAFGASFLFCATVQGQDKKETTATDASYVFERIESVDLTKKEIIGHANAYIAERIAAPKRAIQLNDPELGKLMGDVVLMNPQAGFLDAFKGIKTRFILDARDGRYRLQATNVEGIDGNGNVPANWGKLESANRYRIEPLAQLLLPVFAEDLRAYLKKAKEKSSF